MLYGLVRHPVLNDRELFERIGVKVSRQAVSKMRREFHETGLLRTVRIPNVRALGFDLLAEAWAHFAPGASLKVRVDALERTLRLAPTSFLASSDSDAVVFGAARSYEHFTELRISLSKDPEQRGGFAEEPTVYLGLATATEGPEELRLPPSHAGSVTGRFEDGTMT